MATFLRTIETGIQDSTFNADAAKSREAEAQKLNEKRVVFLKELNTLEKDTTAQIEKKGIQPTVAEARLKLIRETKAWLMKNPNSTPIDFQNQKEKYTILLEEINSKTGEIGSSESLTKYGDFLNSVENDALEKEKKGVITAQQQKDINTKIVEARAWIKSNSSATTDQILINRNTVEDEISAIFGTEEEQKKREVESSEFNMGRLVKKSVSSFNKVLGSFLYVAFALVMGMLAANDAIGREPMYRVLYFIWGSVFAPIALVYYLFRLVMGTRPSIYRMLPLTTVVATTDLGKIFMYPFTYEEDAGARAARDAFLKASAEAVGGSYTSSSGQKGSIGSLLQGLGGILPSGPVVGTGMVTGVETVAQQLQKLRKITS